LTNLLQETQSPNLPASINLSQPQLGHIAFSIQRTSGLAKSPMKHRLPSRSFLLLFSCDNSFIDSKFPVVLKILSERFKILVSLFCGKTYFTLSGID